jgi:restriction endonuclease S subunit
MMSIDGLKSFHKTRNTLPPMSPEQQRIVAILDEVFAAIANKTNAEQNLKNAKSFLRVICKECLRIKG